MPWHNTSPAEQEQLLREAVARCPHAPRARLLLADYLIAQGREAEALAHEYALVGERPHDDDARYCLALRLASMDRYAEALEELEVIERRGGSTVDADVLRGHCLLELGRSQEAEAAFQRALSRNERLVYALRGMAACRRIAGDERKARDFERRAEYYGKTAG